MSFYPLTRERNLILAGLIVLAIAAWAILAWQSDSVDMNAMSSSHAMSDDKDSSAETQAMQSSDGSMNESTIDSTSMDEGRMGLTMNMSVALFLGVWVAMMVAMMFPTAAPMILTFERIQESRQVVGGVFVPTWLFVLAYIGLWSAAGIVAFAAATLADQLAEDSSWLTSNAARIGGAVLVIAGLYQLSSWKNKCLAQCRTPTGFIMTRWRDGRAGAFRMGLEHGGYCLGCCWLLFVILFPLGMMNVAAMALITAVIFAEKSLAIGERIARLAAVGLVSYGVLVLVALPGALPTNVTL